MSKKLGKYLTRSVSATKNLGAIFALRLISKKNKRKTAVVIGLEGDLGSGKTAFLQGFAKGLGIKEKVLSPTFVIQKKFRLKSTSFSNFYHIDCYRLRKPEEIFDLGWKEFVKNPKNIIAVEWPEKIKNILPREAIIIKFRFVDENRREVFFVK